MQYAFLVYAQIIRGVNEICVQFHSFSSCRNDFVSKRPASSATSRNTLEIGQDEPM